jgi:hypothetical protein
MQVSALPGVGRRDINGPPALTLEQVEHARYLLTRPENTIASIARLLGVSRATIHAQAARLPLHHPHLARPTRLPEVGAGRGCARLPAQDRLVADTRRGRAHRRWRWTLRRPELAAEAISAGDSPLSPRESDVLALARRRPRRRVAAVLARL